MSTNNSDLEAAGACASSFGTNRDLFTLPDSSHLGECPICFLPLSLDLRKSILMSCCCTIICNGCDIANKKREAEMGLKQHRCAFCREPLMKSHEEEFKQEMERVKKNDPVAMWHVGKQRYHEGDHETALEYYTKAAELGNAAAHYELSVLYFKGQGDVRDEKKSVYHSEQAAIGGHPVARRNLGTEEVKNGRFERARKHFIIAANLGHDESLRALKDLYIDGHASKGDYADALRAYQAATEAAKSPEREAAEALHCIAEQVQLWFYTKLTARNETTN